MDGGGARLNAPLPGSRLRIDLARQQLALLAADGARLAAWAISSAANGPGERNGSGCTPRGRHRIRALIGAGTPADTVFVGRRPTGEIYDAALAARYPARDWILTRILWLCGEQPGFNRGGAVDSMRRYIYIHGTPATEPMGVPASHGCIRLHTPALLELFPRCYAGMPVLIDSEQETDA